MGKSTQRSDSDGGTPSPERLGSSIRPNVIEVGKLYYVKDLNDEYSRTIAICVGAENARLVERALTALRANATVRRGNE
jgi:hypothetical protein